MARTTDLLIIRRKCAFFLEHGHIGPPDYPLDSRNGQKGVLDEVLMAGRNPYRQFHTFDKLASCLATLYVPSSLPLPPLLGILRRSAIIMPRVM